MHSKVVSLSCLVSTILAPRAFPDPLDFWTKRSSLVLNCVRYCGGMFVGVGAGGLIVTSSNGSSWTVRNSGTVHDLSGVAYGLSTGGGPYFVAVGDDTIVISADATNWSQVSLTNLCSLRDIVPNGFGFLAVGQPNYGLGGPNGLNPVSVLYSVPVGIGGPPTNWESVTVAFPAGATGVTNAHFTSVTRSGGYYIAVGEITTGIWTSSNGRNWTFRHKPFSYVESVASGAGLVVAVGMEGPPLYSLDGGLNWTNSLVDPNLPVMDSVNYFVGYDVAFADGRFVVVGGAAGLLATTNGIDWERHTGPAGRTIQYGPGCFVAAGSDGIFQSDSIAGRLTTQRPPAPVGPIGLSLLVAPGQAFHLEASTNLLQWAEVWRSINNGSVASTQFVDSSFTNFPRRFYRSVVP